MCRLQESTDVRSKVLEKKREDRIESGTVGECLGSYDNSRPLRKDHAEKDRVPSLFSPMNRPERWSTRTSPENARGYRLSFPKRQISDSPVLA